jgi:hypothetical protein
MSLDCVQQFSLLDIPYHHDSLFAPKSIYWLPCRYNVIT